MPNHDPNSAWSRFSDDMKSLGGELRRHYRTGEGEKSSAEINRSLKELGEAADRFFASLDTAGRDPEVRSRTRHAARSFTEALRETVREVGDGLDRVLRQPAEKK